MNSRFGTAVITLAVAQTLILGWMVAGRISILRSPDTVTLASEPVDPRDIFRGDYVTLAYGISRVSLDTTPADKDIDIGDTVYVEIKPVGDTWRAAAIRRTHADPAEGNKVIRGRVVDMARGTPRMRPLPGSSEMESIPCSACLTAVVAYGIESYFVPEGKGRTLEEERNARALSVDVALASDGEAAIKGLRIDGEPVYEEPLL
ncbi:MAG: GDYXXLXY domain-containing protein [Parvibaculum sp.]|uniref:GDYXXLXY domain-containing protein n=1 Tax=Parvibaculum sp. TaxID=2024848 RepID=UPI002847961C|nr:GDYXXLXY domain-containing protein [Parvibaculum sp.]MDR3499256.1 GDYXXLXY domain-containing protein [Parvibaculum sp.]